MYLCVFCRRENELKLPHGWICYLAPEIVRKMSPGNNEDRLPFSNAADVYAFGYGQLCAHTHDKMNAYTCYRKMNVLRKQ